MTKTHFNQTLCISILLLLICPFLLFSQQNSVREDLMPYVTNKSRPNWLKLKKNTNFKKQQFLNLLNKGRSNDEISGFKQVKKKKNKQGKTKYVFEQKYKGIPVEFHSWILHEAEGRIFLAQGRFLKKPNNRKAKADLSVDQARIIALDQLKAIQYAWEIPALEQNLKDLINDPSATYFPDGELVWVARNKKGKLKLAYKFDIYAIEPLARKHVYVNARNGNIIKDIDILHANCFEHHHAAGSKCAAHSEKNTLSKPTTHNHSLGSFAQGTGIANYVASNGGEVPIETQLDGTDYILKTTDFGPNGNQVIHTQHANSVYNYDNLTEFRDADNHWDVNNSAIAAHWGATQTYTYFQETFDRNSYDDDGAPVQSLVHYGHNLVNAYWDGSRLIFGDGNGNEWGPLTSLDLIAHEFTHGVTEHNGLGGLIYKDDSGALNESFSDIFGTVVEFLHHPDGGDWMIGEDFDFANQTGFRNMKDPHLKDHPKTYLGKFWYDSNGDNGGVHFNSGVQNHWFYLLCEGGSGTNEFGHSYDISPIGMDKAAAIAYYNLTTYMNPNSTYQDAKEGALDAALFLYPTDLSIFNTVNEAWCAVGIGEGCGPTIGIEKPVKDEIVTAGKNYTINWASELLSATSNVKIEYTTDTVDSPLWQFIGDNVSNTGTYDWIVPSDYSGTVRVKVTDDGDPAAGRVGNSDILGESNAFVIEACLADNSFDASTSTMVDSMHSFTSNISGDSYEWMIDGEVMDTSQDFDYTFAESGIYDITYKVTSQANGCFNEESRRHYALNPNSSGFTIKVADTQNGGGRAYAQEIMPTKDGGYLFATLFTNMVFKLDAHGVLEWSSNTLPTPTYGNYRVTSLEKEDGNYLIVMGYAESGVTPVSDDLLLIELDGATGEIINNTSQRLSITGRLFPHQIVATDTSYIIGGEYESGAERDIFLVQLKKNDLSLINQSWYGAENRRDYYGEFTLTSDGGLLLGWIQAGSYPEQYVLLKLDGSLQQEWKEGVFSYYARPGTRSRMKILEVPNCEGYMILASANEYANSALVKINTIGNIQWAKRYYVPSESTGQLIAFQDMAWDNHEGVTLLGINGTVLNSNGYPESVEYQLLNVGFDGEQNWKRMVTDLRVVIPSSPSYNLITTNINSTSDGGYILSIPSGDGGETNLIKTDSLGIDGCAIANTIIYEEDITNTFEIELTIQTELDTFPIIQNTSNYTFNAPTPAVTVSTTNCGPVGRSLIAAFDIKEKNISVNTTPTISNVSRGATDYIWKVNGQETDLPLSTFDLAGVYTITLEATDGQLTSTTTKKLNVIDEIDCQIACDLEVEQAYTIQATCPNSQDAQIYTSVTSPIGRTFKYQLFNSADSLLASQQSGYFRDLETGDYRVIVVADNDVSCELDLGIMTLTPKIDSKPPSALCTSAAVDIAFVHGEEGIPYNHANYLQEMNHGVGNDWHQLTYGQLDATKLFSDSYNYIYLEGSDKSADEMEIFINANQQLVEDWVANGNALFINAAPNEGDGMVLGFGGVALVRGTYTSATAVDPTLPIFNGPRTPIASSFTGTFSLAAVISPPSLNATSLLESSNGTDLLVQADWGDGTVLIGGMNLTGFHTPNAEAVNLKANIHTYLKGTAIATVNSPIPIELGADHTYILGLADIDLGSTDDCGIASISLNQENFDCSHAGINEVVLTATDVANNVSTCTTKIEIIDPLALTDIAIEICEGDSYPFNNQALSTSGIYKDTLLNSQNCDSIIVLNLAVKDTSHTLLAESICEGEDYSFNEQTLTIAGTYRDTLQNTNQCDSIIILDLIVHNTSETSITEEICEGDIFDFNNQNLTTAGTYRDTLQNTNQCDSIIILDLIVHNQQETTITKVICNGETFVFNNQNLTTSGVYRDTLLNDNQCDSIVILDLTVDNIIETNLSEAICDGGSYNFNNQDLTAAGIYRDTLQSATSCDSIIILDLTVHNNSETNLSASICSGETFTFNNQSLTTAGIYRDTLLTTNQCDSILILELTVEDIVETNLLESICEGTSFFFKNENLTTAGIYKDTLQSATLCDSILILDLAVLTTSETNLIETICQGESYLFDGQSLTEAGVYQATLQNSVQCDSIINLLLQIEDCGSCPEDHLTVDGNPVQTGTYTAIKTITSSSELADSVTFLAGESITLEPGFHSQMGTSFLGEIAPFICEDPGTSLTNSIPDNPAQSRVITPPKEQIISAEENLTVKPNPFYHTTQLQFTLGSPQSIVLAIHSVEGQEIQVIQEGPLTAGPHTIPYQTNLLNGVYLVVLKTESTVLTQKIISLK